jgi:hypothetical protein
VELPSAVHKEFFTGTAVSGIERSAADDEENQKKKFFHINRVLVLLSQKYGINMETRISDRELLVTPGQSAVSLFRLLSRLMFILFC